MNLNENRVREFAYQIWESEGRPHGQHIRHWEMACKLAANQSGEGGGSGAGNGSAAIQADAPQKKSRSKKQPTSSDTKAVKKAAETKSTTAKTTRQKKAKVLTDTVDTKLTPITEGFEGSV